MSTRERLDFASVVGESIEIPCETRRHKGDAPAGWVLWTTKCCDQRVDRGFICRVCLDHFLTTENAVVCDICGDRTEPARNGIVRYEPINLPAV